MGGTLGLFFREFSMTLAFAIGVSTVLALTLTPMVCARMGRPTRPLGRLDRWIEGAITALVRLYGRSLEGVLHRRGWALLRGAAARLRRKAGAEPAQILAQGRDAVLCLLGALVRRFFLAVEQTLARADVCDGCGKSVPAEGQPRGALAGLLLGFAGAALDLDDPLAHGLDRFRDDVGRALLALGGGAFARGHAVLGLLDPARDRIERSGSARARLARQLFGRGGLADERVDLGARRVVRRDAGGGVGPALRQPREALGKRRDVELFRRCGSRSRRLRLVALVANLVVEPFAQGHAGAAGRRLRGVAGSRVDALDAPGQAVRHVRARLQGLRLAARARLPDTAASARPGDP